MESLSVFSIRHAAAEMGVSYPDALFMRLKFVRQQMFMEIRDLDSVQGITTDSDEIIFWTAWNNVIDLAHEQQALVNALRYRNAPERNQITPGMIETARSYPIDQIVTFDRLGRATAFCHDDARPSLSWDRKHNRAHCFPCGRSFNAIDVLVCRDGMSFCDAVTQLVSGGNHA